NVRGDLDIELLRADVVDGRRLIVDGDTGAVEVGGQAAIDHVFGFPGACIGAEVRAEDAGPRRRGDRGLAGCSVHYAVHGEDRGRRHGWRIAGRVVEDDIEVRRQGADRRA